MGRLLKVTKIFPNQQPQEIQNRVLIFIFFISFEPHDKLLKNIDMLKLH